MGVLGRVLDLVLDLLHMAWKAVGVVWYVIPTTLKLFVGALVGLGLVGILESANFFDSGFGYFLWSIKGWLGLAVLAYFAYLKFGYAVALGRAEMPVTAGRGGAGSGLDYTNTIENFEPLRRALFYRYNSGEPLIADGQAAHNQNLDAWGIDGNNQRHRYTVSTQERGLVLGVSGTGKSTFLITQLVDWMQSGKSFVVTDIKPEIWAILQVNGVFARYGYNDVVINPTDANADNYNMFDDIDDDNDITELLNIIIPDKGNDSDAFAATARLILKAVLLHVKEKKGATSLPAARDYIDEYVDIDEMLDDLMDSDSKIAARCAKNAKRSASNERYLASAVTALINALGFLDNETIANSIDSSDFSLKDTLMRSKQAVFLQFDKEYKETTRVLFGATLAHTLRLLEVNFRDRDEVFVAIDEIINAAPIPRLTEKMNVIRSSKMPLFLYLQTLEGLNRVYGEKADEMFMSACAVKICYRVDDLKTAKSMSEFIGTVEVKNWQVNHKDRQGHYGIIQDEVYNEQTQLMPKIEPVALTKLGKGQAIICYQGESAVTAMPYFRRTFSAMTVDTPDFGTRSDLLALEQA